MAAERAGRRARLIELDRKYVDVIVERWQGETGRSRGVQPMVCRSARRRKR
jgi:DNA modification methylase